MRRERPHPGAQLRFTDADGWRFQVFLTDTGRGALAHRLAGLEVRHRGHARVEDRIRAAKATGLLNFPCRALPENRAWLRARPGRHRPTRLRPAPRAAAGAQSPAHGALASPAAAAPADLWAAVRQCESGGNYSTNTRNGVYGAYQFTLQTWRGLGMSGLPSDAS